ncbi:hypothetical protein KTT_05220 [Tengunoibacter tsumagoiensis]|uniref:Uncharacterized protein n=1 Tax=Tengunoibacter tsumagoiensis TaxID=2014871 RepID=A0A401ZUV5_9CHLR|nr:hypothetical protein KTT_05220 [Tengunoibacter tsumagoiensis]
MVFLFLYRLETTYETLLAGTGGLCKNLTSILTPDKDGCQAIAERDSIPAFPELVVKRSALPYCGDVVYDG